MSRLDSSTALRAGPAWPSQCEICRQWCEGGLCADCVTRFAAAVPRCGRCGLRLGVATRACGACLQDPPPFEHTIAAVDYGFPWDLLVSAFKFQARPELAAALAARMAAAVGAAGLPLPDAVLPMPLAPRRLAQRGYNQAWELARRVAAALQLPAAWPDRLLRPLDTAPQAGLGRTARQLNLRTAFMVEPRHRASLAGRRVALVDDVMTTGASVREASAALLRSGVAAVDVWVLARTPEAPA